MHFVQTYKKPIALFVALAFFWLIQASVLPLHAAAKPETGSAAASMTTDDNAPGAIEKQSPSYAKEKKKSSILPIILIVVAVGAVAAVLILVVFKTKYNIVGTWRVTNEWDEGGGGATLTYFFRGDKERGDVILQWGTGEAKVGEYTVDGKDVTFWVLINTYTGKFTDKNNMAGTNRNTLNETGTWEAIKTSDETQGAVPVQTQEQLNKQVRAKNK